jgi:hypothetical protein
VRERERGGERAGGGDGPEVRRADGLLRKITEKKEGGEMGRVGRMGREEFFSFFSNPF